MEEVAVVVVVAWGSDERIDLDVASYNDGMNGMDEVVVAVVVGCNLDEVPYKNDAVEVVVVMMMMVVVAFDTYYNLVVMDVIWFAVEVVVVVDTDWDTADLQAVD